MFRQCTGRLANGIIRAVEALPVDKPGYSSRVVPGQTAVATVLRVEVPGEVTRVDPAVTQNAVAVDIAFRSELPSGARPDLSIRATITVAELDDALFVRRPLRVNDDSAGSVFRLAGDGRSATRTSVRFGMGTLKHIEVLDGLNEGDTIVVGNVSRFENEETLAIR